MRRSNFQDLTGRKFNRWTVLAFAGTRHESSFWLCRCECGSEKEVPASGLKSGHSKSCGCHRREATRLRSIVHGHSGNPTYKCWEAMISRCHNPADGDYARYGERGIAVCQLWRDSFTAFIIDMGEMPSGLTLDRIENNGNYEPGNCRWATRRVQSNNRDCTVLLTLGEVTQPLAIWAEQLGIHRDSLRNRLKRGWPLERALSTRTTK